MKNLLKVIEFRDTLKSNIWWKVISVKFLDLKFSICIHTWKAVEAASSTIIIAISIVVFIVTPFVISPWRGSTSCSRLIIFRKFLFVCHFIKEFKQKKTKKLKLLTCWWWGCSCGSGWSWGWGSTSTSSSILYKNKILNSILILYLERNW